MINDNIVNLAAEAGKIMLQNGGETYRVEQTISMICSSYNIKNAESFVSPTAIITSTTNENGRSSTIIKRITSRSIDLQKVALINNLSRKIQVTPINLNQLSKELEDIRNYPKYSNRIKTFFAGVNTGTFTLLFGGNIFDFIIAFFAGILINLLTSMLSRLSVNDFFINVAGGSLAGIIGLVFSSINPVFHQDKIIIGSIMLLVPGLVITNAIRDTISGDLLSGLARSLEAIMIAGAIAIGTAFSFKLWIALVGGV
ncbi:threonine/serine exporter family protein [Clostridium sp.]|uniref:threonine/serine exporter family protein n=1 Tax=Clostridium sp. TaxID=1506 RepID=UPI003216EA8A